MPLRSPTADSTALISTAVRGLRAIFKPGFNYAKAGVMLLDLQDGAVEQGELDLDAPCSDRAPLMNRRRRTQRSLRSPNGIDRQRGPRG